MNLTMLEAQRNDDVEDVSEEHGVMYFRESVLIEFLRQRDFEGIKSILFRLSNDFVRILKVYYLDLTATHADVLDVFGPLSSYIEMIYILEEDFMAVALVKFREAKFAAEGLYRNSARQIYPLKIDVISGIDIFNYVRQLLQMTNFNARIAPKTLPNDICHSKVHGRVSTFSPLDYLLKRIFASCPPIASSLTMPPPLDPTSMFYLRVSSEPTEDLVKATNGIAKRRTENELASNPSQSSNKRQLPDEKHFHFVYEEEPEHQNLAGSKKEARVGPISSRQSEGTLTSATELPTDSDEDDDEEEMTRGDLSRVLKMKKIASGVRKAYKIMKQNGFPGGQEIQSSQSNDEGIPVSKKGKIDVSRYLLKVSSELSKLSTCLNETERKLEKSEFLTLFEHMLEKKPGENAQNSWVGANGVRELEHDSVRMDANKRMGSEVSSRCSENDVVEKAAENKDQEISRANTVISFFVGALMTLGIVHFRTLLSRSVNA